MIINNFYRTVFRVNTPAQNGPNNIRKNNDDSAQMILRKNAEDALPHSPSIENFFVERLLKIPEISKRIFSSLDGEDKKNARLAAKPFKAAVDDTVSHIKAYDSRQLREALKLFGSTESLYLEFDADFEFTEDLAEILSKRRIVSLDFSYRSDVTDKNLAWLSTCQYLQELNLAHCISLTGDFIRYLTNPEKITVLNLSGCANLIEGSHTAVLKRFQDLRELNLANYRGSVCDFLSLLPAPEKLITLDLTFIDRVNEQLAAILAKFINLRELKFVSCEEITDGFLLHLQNLEKLAILDFSGCFNLVDKSLIAVLAKCPNLQELILCTCKNLKGNFVSVLQKLHELKSVSIAGCKGIESENWKKLKQFNQEKVGVVKGLNLK